MKRNELGRLAILLLAIVYFLAAVPMNISGAEDKNMLAVFSLDEYAQYYEVAGRADWLIPIQRQSLQGFFTYSNTQYGFLFSLISALVVLFFQAASDLTGHWNVTFVSVFFLRQLCVCCFLLGSYFFSQIFCDSRDKFQQAWIFVFLLLVPGAFRLNSVWKPDQGVYLLVALGLYWTSRAMDRGPLAARELMLGTFFWGMAAGLKAYGWFAAPLLLLAAILVWGRFPWREPARLLRHGAIFICGFLVSQPVMISPRVAWRVIERLLTTINNSTRANDQNRISNYLTSADVEHWYRNAFHYYYGHWLFLIAAIVATVAGMPLDKPRRNRYLAVLVWVAPISAYVVTQIEYTGEERYWLPIWMPVLAAFLSFCLWAVARSRWTPLGIAGCILAGTPALQAAEYVKADAEIWRLEAGRETVAPALFFYRKVEHDWLSKMPKNRDYSIFRDPYVYFPPSLAGFNVRMRYKDTTFSDVVEVPTDILLVQVDYIKINASDENLADKQASPLLWNSYLFYSDVRDDKVRGFKKIYQDKFGIFFVSDALFRQLPQSFWKPT